MNLSQILIENFDRKLLTSSLLISTDNEQLALEDIKKFCQEIYRNFNSVTHLAADISPPNLYLIEKNKEAKFITIDLVRNMQQFMLTKNSENEYRICLIYQADLLNESSANCLLKVLEEPKQNNIIILLTSKSYSLMPTIRSRCHKVAYSYKEHASNDEFLIELDNWMEPDYFVKILNGKIDKLQIKQLALASLERIKADLDYQPGRQKELLIKYTKLKKIADDIENYDLDPRSSAILLYEELKE